MKLDRIRHDAGLAVLVVEDVLPTAE